MNYQPPQQVIEALKALEQWNIVSHINPDGDTLGCGCALYNLALHLGKKARWVGRDPLPGRYQFLPQSHCYEACGEQVPDLSQTIWLDISDGVRGLPSLVESVAVNVDHHPTNPAFGKAHWIEPRASATAELVWAIVKALTDVPNKDVATALYTALVTDNGNFVFPSVRTNSFVTAAELLTWGADPAAIDLALNHQERPEKLKLWGRCLSRLERVGERGCISWVSEEDFALTGARIDETEDLVNQLTRLACADMAVLAIERPGLLRCSFRSRPPLCARVLAEQFGGGGHDLAAGARFDGTLADGVEQLKRAMIDHERIYCHQ